MKKKIYVVILTILAVLICVPFFFLIIGSFMDTGELETYLGGIMNEELNQLASWTLLPVYPTLRSYIQLFLDSPEFFVMFWNTVKITVLILLGQLVMGVPAAWAFAQTSIPGKNKLFNLYVMLMLMPFQVTMLSNYLTLNQLHLINTQWAVILPAAFSTFPVFICYRFFREIPKALIEAAELDGAGRFRIFFTVGIPMASSGIIASMVLGFIEAWNMIEQPLVFLEDKSLWPLSLYLPNVNMSNIGLAFAASVVTLIPSILVFLGGQSYLEQGITASAVKG